MSRRPPAKKPHQVWQRPAVAAARERIRAALDEIGAAAGPAGAARAAAAGATRDDPSLDGQLASVLHACEALDRHARTGALAPDEVRRLYRGAAATLARNRIRPGTSRVAHLHGELQATMARIAAAEGRSWAAAWRHVVARYQGGGAAPDHHALFRQASLDLQLGLADGALARLLDAELPGDPAIALTSLRLARARILRLGGALDEAAGVLAGVVVAGDAASGHRIEVRWEEACLASQRSGSPAPQAALARRDRAARIPRRLLELFLWCHAVRTTELRREGPRASSLRRTAAAELDPITLRCAVAIERCYAGRGPVEARVDALGRALAAADEIEAVDQLLLVWAAAGRWLVRIKRPDLASLPMARYRALSLGLTAGADPDVLAVAAGLALDERIAGSVDELRAAPPGDPPPADRLRRSVALARMAASIARVGVADLARRRWPGAAAGAHLDEDHLIEYAEIAAHHLGQLKGPIMKIGQLLSYYGIVVPPEVTAAFATLQDGARAVDAGCVVDTVERELGRPIADAFARFERRPLATGSIGQVHAAELHDGRPVAVKVQYPDIERIVRGDLALLALARPIARHLLPSWDVDGLAGELGARILEECDYRREAADQRYFHELLAGEPDIRVPAPVEALTRARVLVTERVDGLRFERFCQEASQAARDRAGRAVMRYVVKTVSAERAFNTDMHPGNLLFADDAVHFVDFGSVRRYPGSDTSGFPRVVAAVIARDVAALRGALIDLEFVDPAAPFDGDLALELLGRGALASLSTDAPSRFDPAMIRGDVAMLMHELGDGQIPVVPPKHLYFFRLFWGMSAVLAQLGAEANWRRVALEVLDEAGVRV